MNDIPAPNTNIQTIQLVGNEYNAKTIEPIKGPYKDIVSE